MARSYGSRWTSSQRSVKKGIPTQSPLQSNRSILTLTLAPASPSPNRCRARPIGRPYTSPRSSCAGSAGLDHGRTRAVAIAIAVNVALADVSRGRPRPSHVLSR